MSSDIYDRLVKELHNVERRWAPNRGSNVIKIGEDHDLMHDLQRSVAKQKSVQRVRNVLRAIDESFPAAFDEITKKLRGVSIDLIKPILRDLLTDVALYLGGSTALGMGIGGGLGAFAGGIGAIPGAMIGGWLGFGIGNVIMALTGLKSVVVFMKDTVPAAIRWYGIGFRNAWGEPTNHAPYASFASKNIAQGHVLFLMALLMGIVAYLTRGKGDFGALLAEIRLSKRLGPKMANWLEANKDDLLKNPELRQGIKASVGGSDNKVPLFPSSSGSSPPYHLSLVYGKALTRQ